MKDQKEKVRKLPGAGDAVGILRQFTSALREIADFDRFVTGLETALGESEIFDRTALSLFPKLQAEENELYSFPESTFSLPLASEEKVMGTINFGVQPSHRQLSAQDLHLMGGLADLISVLVDHALQFGEQRRNLALLGFLLSQVPVGVVCFDPTRRILVSNSLGRRLLGINDGAGEVWLLPEDWHNKVKKAGPSGEFHRRVAGQLLHVQAKSTSSGLGDEITALVLADLTADQDRFHQALARETYRCGWLARPISLAVLGAKSPGGLMASLRPLRERLGSSAIVGPCDSDAIGIIFPEAPFPQAMERFRSVRTHLENDWEGGVASLNDVQGSPETLFAAAAAARCRVGDFLKHRLLLHDDYASVNDMLELVLRDDFTVSKSGNYNETMRQLRSGRFDGFFSEIDLSNGGDPLELARVAREANPKIRSFFTSVAANVRRESPLFQKETVFQKPFDIREVVGTVKAAFA